MITIQILGLDQFVVGHYSADHTGNLAQLFETEENDINFYAPNSMIFHNGAEQTSWHTVVIVRLPEKFHPLEDAVADYLLKTLTEFSINVEVQFDYYEEHHRHVSINPNYPRYITSEQIRDASLDQDYLPGLGGEEEEPEEEAEGEAPEEEIDLTDPEQVFLGNAFEGFEEALAGETKRNK